jgi:hypothetical protein
MTVCNVLGMGITKYFMLYHLAMVKTAVGEAALALQHKHSLDSLTIFLSRQKRLQILFLALGVPCSLD